MPSLHVLLRKEDLQPVHLEDRIVIVLDILFATSTMVHAFWAGVEGIWPALDTHDANVVAQGVGSCIKSGEYLASICRGSLQPFPSC